MRSDQNDCRLADDPFKKAEYMCRCRIGHYNTDTLELITEIMRNGERISKAHRRLT